MELQMAMPMELEQELELYLQQELETLRFIRRSYNSVLIRSLATLNLLENYANICCLQRPQNVKTMVHYSISASEQTNNIKLHNGHMNSAVPSIPPPFPLTPLATFIPLFVLRICSYIWHVICYSGAQPK